MDGNGQPASAPYTLRAMGSSVWALWTSERVTLEYARIAEHTETVTAEITTVSQQAGEIHWGRINLLAAQARAGYAAACAVAAPDCDWRSIIDVTSKAVIRHLRAGLPAVPLAALEPIPDWIEDRWLVRDLIPRGQITVLFADGGQGKSRLALALAVSGLLGQPLSPVWRVGALQRVLYLDWESDQDDHARRLWELTRPLEPVVPGAILYQRLHRALTDHVDQLGALVEREHVDLVITDSLGAASGSEPESNEAALRTFAALRAMRGPTHLVLAHVSKLQADSDGPRRPFGGVYVTNTARSTIEARGESEDVDEGDEDAEQRLVVTLHHRKSNLGRLVRRPSALAFTWRRRDGACLVSAAIPDLTSASLPAQLLQILSQSTHPESVSLLAEQTGATPVAVRVALHRLQKRNKVVCLSVSGPGRGKESQWGRVDAKRIT